MRKERPLYDCSFKENEGKLSYERKNERELGIALQIILFIVGPSSLSNLAREVPPVMESLK